jgi:hypothetical protein
MTPGTYELQLGAGKAPGRAGTRVRYTVTGKNLELPLTLHPVAAIPGRIVAAPGVRDVPLSTFKVSFVPVVTGLTAAQLQPHPVDGEGRFEFSDVLPARLGVEVSGLGNEFFVKEVRYRGVPAPGSVFDYSGDGGLEIEVDRGPATLTGSVTKNDRPLPEADVVLIRWPLGAKEDRTAIRHIAADGDGKFQITSIVPGEYRIFAVEADVREIAERPAAWQRLLTRAQRVTRAQAASQNVVLTVSDPSR